MKHIKYLYMAFALTTGAFVTSSCNDFLDRPAEDSYNAGTFYKDDSQCVQGVNYLYNSPWYDFQRGFIKVGEVWQLLLGLKSLYDTHREQYRRRPCEHV